MSKYYKWYSSFNKYLYLRNIMHEIYDQNATLADLTLGLDLHSKIASYKWEVT